MANKTLFWFRQDLRLLDNPGFAEACAQGEILPVYILDDINAGDHAMGEASRWWLHHALQSLSKSMKNQLIVLSGDPKVLIPDLVEKYQLDSVYWNRCYEPWRIVRDKAIKKSLDDKEVDVKSFNASLLWEPWEVLKKDGTPYKVFTPYYRKGCLNAIVPRMPLPKSKSMKLLSHQESMSIDDVNLLPQIPWDKQMQDLWEVSEKGARKRLDTFLEEGICDYKEGRNFPAKRHTSQLSPYLHFGLISPNEIWYSTKECMDDTNSDHFLSELGWREFSYSLLYHFPQLPKKNLQQKFDRFPWKKSKRMLRAWQKGQTGYPIVDAGMRELWQTGYMHNRVRMIVGSFLVKNLLLHWRDGERWFWDCLVDADLASNSASWQWVAGCGADAAPYFRIFNPITQGEKFDPEGEYTLKYIPELKNMPKKFLYKPWEAPELVLQEAGVTLGKDYPKPIVDCKQSRETALEAFSSLKGDAQ